MIDLPATRRENLQKIRDKRFTSNAELARGYLDEPHEIEQVPTRFGKKIPILSFVQASNWTNTGDDSCF